MFVGDSNFVFANVYPENASNKTVLWSSSDTSVATVDQNSGLVIAKGAGVANIYATACDGSGVSGCCEVTCNPEHSSHIYHATLSEDGSEYTFTCTSSQCNDSFTVPKDQVIGSYVTSSTDPHLGNSQTPLAYGIDLSSHQGEILQSQWNAIANTKLLPEYDFWYARHYDDTPNNWQSNWAGVGRKFGMWQYAMEKPIPPISEDVDYDVAYKNYPLIIKALHLNNFN